MRYLSVCSGIEAATVAWHGLSWQAAAFSEIEAFPLAVLAHRWPEVPRHGDFTTIEGNEYGTIDLLVGGTPCQSFSVAGKRLGLDDPRGNLAIEFLRLAVRCRARWVVWENVPGVLSSWSDEESVVAGDDGYHGRWEFNVDQRNDFETFLSLLGQCGYGFAWRVLDAQYFGVPQRRRRVFVVGYLGDWRPAGAVLFERESLRGDITPRRKAREGTAPTLSARTKSGGGFGTDFDCDGGLISHTVTEGTRRSDRGDGGQTLVTHTLRGDGFDASEDGTGRGIPLVAGTVSSKWAKGTGGPSGDECQNLVAIQERAVSENPQAGPDGKGWRNDGLAYTLESRSTVQAVAFNLRGREGGAMPEIDEKASLRAASGGSSRSYIASSAVRRLTPRECERLQGFPDDYTLVPYRGKPAADGPRYKALGNSMAVPVMRWIGERIQAVEALQQARAA